MTGATPFWQAMFIAAAVFLIVVVVAVLNGFGFTVDDARIELIIGVLLGAGGMAGGRALYSLRTPTPPADEGDDA